ncbi:YbhN family protein [Jatrophihabitans telluris]|uniref:YbhN family protein n=1 Tax=Jatrophihabitans telluris TaxID=2038343 RepID=A0ABY4QSK6_9ACTN|nr:YbhN family protein [Jatrophihabitans telluris]UQX86612.1 YbhN family protein [Jatrophihabitans telluris]
METLAPAPAQADWTTAFADAVGGRAEAATDRGDAGLIGETAAGPGRRHAAHWRWTAARRRAPAWLTPLAAVLLGLSALISVRAADPDGGSDLWALLQSAGSHLLRWRWQFTAVVAALAALHYAATAVAARAAAGLRLPLAETMLVQLAASAANRISAAGLGGSATNARYFSRRGLPAAGALGAVAALGVLGAVADIAVLGLLVLVGPSLGLAGAANEIGVLAATASGAISPLHSRWTWLVVAAIAGGAVLTRAVWGPRIAGVARRSWSPVSDLLHSPARLSLLLAASGATTLILAFAFAASVAMIPGSSSTAGLGALLVGFMFGAAAGNAVPLPAGVGSTEAALVAVLMTAGSPAGPAVQVVIAYRILTFWLPPAAGLLALRRLRRRGAL